MPNEINDIPGGLIVYPPKNKAKGKVVVIPVGESDISGSLLVKRHGNLSSNINVYSEYVVVSISPPIYGSQKKASFTIPHRDNLPATLGIKPNGKFSSIINIIEQPKITTKFPPIKDAFVREAVPTLNYGSEGTMQIGYNTNFSERYRSLIQFDLSSIPTEQTIYSAKLKLFNSSAATFDQQIGLYSAYNTWDEKGVTWSNQPYVDSFVTSVDFGSQRGYVEFDVTNIVMDWYSGAKDNNGLIIKSINELLAQYISVTTKENASSDKPYLEVVYSDSTVYSYGSLILPSSGTVRVSKLKDLTSSMNVRFNDNVSWFPSRLHVHTPDEIMFEDLTSNIAINKPDQPANITIRRKETNELPCSISVQQKFVFDFDGKTTISSPDRPGHIFIPYRDDLISNVMIKGLSYRNLNSNMQVIRRELPSSMLIKYRDDLNSKVNIRGLEVVNFNSTIAISKPHLLSSMVIKRKEKSEITGKIEVRRGSVNDSSAKIAVSRPDLPASIRTGLSSYIEGSITIRAFEKVSLPAKVIVPYRSNLTSHINVTGASMIPASINILSGFIRANIRIPTRSVNDKNGKMTVRVRFISDLPSRIRVGGDTNDESYVFIM